MKLPIAAKRPLLELASNPKSRGESSTRRRTTLDVLGTSIRLWNRHAVDFAMQNLQQAVEDGRAGRIRRREELVKNSVESHYIGRITTSARCAVPTRSSPQLKILSA